MNTQGYLVGKTWLLSKINVLLNGKSTTENVLHVCIELFGNKRYKTSIVNEQKYTVYITVICHLFIVIFISVVIGHNHTLYEYVQIKVLYCIA